MYNKDYSISPGSHIHLMGICGVAMSSIAGMLKEKGYKITGSDQNIYPPISTFLKKLSIPLKKGYSPSNLHPTPDLVIVGNVITKDNPEAVELMRIGVPYLSMPQALRRFAFDKKKPIVVAGTHGKTTTSALIAWILEVAGMEPSFMIGGIAKNFNSNFKLTGGSYFVIEGDEYDTAFFDKGPKFMHYNPYITVITNIEFDHADIYKNIEGIKVSFENLIKIIPADGLLCVNLDDPLILNIIKQPRCSLKTYAINREANLKIGYKTISKNKTHITILKENKLFLNLVTDLYGQHNFSNILAAVSVATYLGINDEIIAHAIETFKGVNRRLEILGEVKDVLIIDDFAHHPTAVRETIKAVKGHYKSRRIVAVFEPRSNSSRRSIFQHAYAASFNDADLVIIPEPPMMSKIPLDDRFSSSRLVRDLNKIDIKSHY
ncbi:MAG: Mur ligase family protein, partial [Thermodesulfobacteriota bacterium]|nr:Mur ligase family protein [Thermodesulfobacteriota bacterium]